MIDGVSSATTVSMSDSSSTTSTTEELGKDDFLLLLVTQLQNQDPLNPTDNTEFVSQLAQFSSLEGIKNMEETMGTVADGISDMQKWSLSDLIDNTVKFESSSFDFSGEPVSIEYSLGSNAESANVSIYDASGNLIKSVDAGALNSGTYELQWDGTDAAGAVAASGTYTINITAVDSSGASVDTSTYVSGKVTSVTYGSDGAEINAGNIILTQDDILEVY
ncbi:MAG TPA: flagellar biosynthesis protein FlgD [Deltaproteobacteria bacterium]|nr:flagellar biosynthesis protein FlgD [Deltaproteobacteria bacterium]